MALTAKSKAALMKENCILIVLAAESGWNERLGGCDCCCLISKGGNE